MYICVVLKFHCTAAMKYSYFLFPFLFLLALLSLPGTATYLPPVACNTMRGGNAIKGKWAKKDYGIPPTNICERTAKKRLSATTQTTASKWQAKPPTSTNWRKSKEERIPNYVQRHFSAKNGCCKNAAANISNCHHHALAKCCMHRMRYCNLTALQWLHHHPHLTPPPCLRHSVAHIIYATACSAFMSPLWPLVVP